MFARLALLMCLCLVLAPYNARATSRYVVGTVKVYPTAVAHNDAIPIDTSQSTSYCAYSRMYIQYEDKEMYARALAAEVNGTTMVVWYDDAAPTANFETHASTSCRVQTLYKQ